MNLGLGGKVALVTGGARDVGREISLTLAREGAAVAVNYLHSKAEADALVAEIVRLGGRAAAYGADVADHGAVSRMVARIVSDLGRLDVVVNNAGLVAPKLFLETTPEEWRREVDVCLYGVFNVCHAAAPKLAAQKGGRIISIVGDSARVGQQRLGVSAGARGAVLSLTRTLAKEFGRLDITVNALASAGSRPRTPTRNGSRRIASVFSPSTRSGGSGSPTTWRRSSPFSPPTSPVGSPGRRSA